MLDANLPMWLAEQMGLDDDIRSALLAGETPSAIAARLGVSRSLVYYYRARQEGPPGPRRAGRPKGAKDSRPRARREGEAIYRFTIGLPESAAIKLNKRAQEEGKSLASLAREILMESTARLCGGGRVGRPAR